MPSKKLFKTGRQELSQAFLEMKTSKEMDKFLEDLLTPQELETLVERWLLIKLLLDGKTQREVRDELGIGIATVTRGSKQLKYGTGGFEMAVKRVGD
ncbi:MAG: YerC/YecD family TrpR-related protein [Candidatus Peregrinibacteria bacterium]|nr:YerC/YecD family TrpR-related protein [Candidatus Peregrinibacteria bacterium]